MVVVADFDMASVTRRYSANLREVLDIAVDCRMTLDGIQRGGQAQ